jgi:hypothetical protein
VLSNQVRVPVSSHASASKCRPRFKVALVICQEEYSAQRDFHNLNAPRRDGSDLVAKLHEMDFKVSAEARTLEAKI